MHFIKKNILQNKRYIYIGLFIISVFIFVILYISKKLPDLNSNINTSKQGIYLTNEILPQGIIKKIINIEDKRFYNNYLGVDFFRFFKSFYNNLQSDKTQGGSTIDQQLIKIMSKNYGNRSFFTKTYEILSALALNLKYDKNQILYSYINNLPMTNNIVGIKSACSIYFEKSCDYLTESEQYFIISIYQLGINPHSPDKFNKIKNRSKFLCDNYGGANCENIYNELPISHNDLGTYINDINPSISIYLKSQKINFDNNDKNTYRDQDIYNTVQTSINILKPHLSNSQIGDCCVIILDGKGNLISMNLCRSQKDNTAGSAINMCLTKRQTGSSIKPFLYLLGLFTQKITITGNIVDEPVTYFLENNNEYQPKNFDLKYHGEVTVGEALGSSLNIPAVKILHDVGLINFQDRILKIRYIYHSMNQTENNIYSDHQTQIQNDLGLSMALGTYNFTPLEFTNLWRIFIDKDKTYMSMITKDYHHTDQDFIFDVYNMISDNINRYISFGINNRLNLSGRASKSGTSRNFVDGRTCGANKSKNRVVCVRVGNHDNRSALSSSSQTASLLWNLIAKSL